MKIGFLVPDNRDELRRYGDPAPYFGPAPTALLEGLAEMPDCEVHIVCCLQKPLPGPPRLASSSSIVTRIRQPATFSVSARS